jgi:drug/metabolite transporter (DMT)-like permease
MVRRLEKRRIRFAVAAPARFRHVVLDNGVYASTGNQPTISSRVALDEIARERGNGLHFSTGALIILVGAISYGVYMVLQKKLLGKYTAFEFTCYAFWAGTLLMIPFAPGLMGEIRTAPPNATWAVVYLGVFPAAVANVAWGYTLSRVAAAQVSSYLYLMPVVTVAIAWVWLGEVPTILTLTGGLIALAGVVMMHQWGHAGPES